MNERLRVSGSEFTQSLGFRKLETPKPLEVPCGFRVSGVGFRVLRLSPDLVVAASRPTCRKWGSWILIQKEPCGPIEEHG